MKQRRRERKLAGRVAGYERTLSALGKKGQNPAGFHRPGSVKK